MREAHRIKCLALLVMLLYFTGDLMQQFSGEIGTLLFTRLERELCHKLSNEKAKGNYSPGRFNTQTRPNFEEIPTR